MDDTLQNYGFRVQKSVFECRLSRGDKKRLHKQLENLNIEIGHIRCYSITATNIKIIGIPPEEIDDEHIYFID